MKNEMISMLYTKPSFLWIMVNIDIWIYSREDRKLYLYVPLIVTYYSNKWLKTGFTCIRLFKFKMWHQEKWEAVIWSLIQCWYGVFSVGWHYSKLYIWGLPFCALELNKSQNSAAFEFDVCMMYDIVQKFYGGKENDVQVIFMLV